jgi:hypothetical protein
MKYAKYSSEIPTTEHYVILTFDSIYIPGDERSRTNPGHGYPESTERVVNYIVFEDKEKWEKEINRRERNGDKSWLAIKSIPAKITKTLSVHIE